MEVRFLGKREHGDDCYTSLETKTTFYLGSRRFDAIAREPARPSWMIYIGENNLGDFRFFLIFYSIFGFFGVYIIPNWLIKVPGYIPMLFR